jgi:serine/threonine protein kinase
MNTQDSPKTNPGQQRPQDIGKTFVEGSDAGANTGYHPLSAGSRVDATSLSATNPYGVKRAPSPPPQADSLPTGNDPLPLGSGTIVGLLGAGGMARVYKIWNEKLEVFRAVKILIPTQQGDLRNRFETEAKITAKLRHPNIVEIYSVGDWNGLPYLEMELIDGTALDAMIQRIGKLPPSVCSAISIFVARALTYAHNQEFLLYGKTYQGIIHRDLKPANIMISKHGDLRLMDFGIARPTEASLHTVEGNIVGTMQYLSPEQMDGVDVDARADVYSFGAILYEMLTGTKTFPQDTITNLMKRKIMNEYRKFDDFDFGVPQSLAKIAQKCLQLDKTNRYANATVLLDELEDAHRSLTSDSPETVLKSYLDNPSSISSNTGRKRPAFLSLKIVIPAAAVVVIGVLVAVFVATGPKSSEEPHQQAVAVQPQKPVEPTPQPAAPAAQPALSQPADNGLKPLSPQPAEPDLGEKQSEPQTPRSAVGREMEARYQAARLAAESRKSSRQSKSANAVHETGFAKEQAPDNSASSTDRLKKSYGTSDFVEIGQRALAKNEFDDAVLSLENVPSGSPQHEKAFLMLIDALIQSDKLHAAKEKIQSEQVNDGEYSLLSGEMYQKMGRNKDALENFQTALTRPSKYRNIRDVRNDALYYTALTYSEMYKDDPSNDNRGMALQSWRVVKNMYSSNPDNGRYRKAVNELASIK